MSRYPKWGLPICLVVSLFPCRFFSCEVYSYQNNTRKWKFEGMLTTIQGVTEHTMAFRKDSCTWKSVRFYSQREVWTNVVFTVAVIDKQRQRPRLIHVESVQNPMGINLCRGLSLCDVNTSTQFHTSHFISVSVLVSVSGTTDTP